MSAHHTNKTKLAGRALWLMLVASMFALLVSGFPLGDYVTPVARADTNPDDPHYQNGDQWNLQRIDAPGAWDISRGNNDIIVAVIDSGTDYNHADFKNRDNSTNIFTDSEGHHGYDFVQEDWDPSPIDQGDPGMYVHGTVVAGIIGAATDNGTGMAGINWHVKIMPMRAMQKGDAALSCMVMDRLARAVRSAVDSGARVINMSLGVTAVLPTCTSLDDALAYASSHNVVVVAGTGNGISNTGPGVPFVMYPARNPNVIAVGATDDTDHRASFSDYGKEVAIVAPGTSLFSLYPGSKYPSTAGLSGTSFASPQVAGAAALVLSVNPSLTASQVRNILTASADKVGGYDYSNGGHNDEMGYGRLNLRKALELAAPLIAPVLQTPENDTIVGSLRPTFDWSTVPGIDKYIIAVSESSSFSPIDVLGQPTESSFTPSSDLKRNTRYYWRVHAVRGYQVSPFSEVWSFTTPGESIGTCNNAAYIRDVTYPDNTIVSPGQAIDKAWEVRNTGDCTWNTGYRLAFDGGDKLGAPDYVNIPQETRPGQSVIIHVPMTAPSSGTPRGYWKMADPSGSKFGDRMWVQVIVTPNECMAIVSMDYPTLMWGNQDFVPKIRIRLLTGTLQESRGDMLACYDAADPQNPGCKQHADWRFGAWEFVPVKGTVSSGQEYTFSFSDTFASNKMTSPNGDGTYNSPWRIWRKNPDGSWAFCGPQMDIRFTVDAGGPSVSLLQPANGAYINSNANIELIANANDSSGVTRVRFQYNDGSWHDISSDDNGADGWRATWNPSGVADRANLQLKATAEDRLGNQSDATNQVTLDRTPPSSAVTALTARQPNLSFPVAWSGSDNVSGVQAYRVQVRDGTAGAWTDWYVGTGTSGDFTGQLGRTYCFQSSAIDGAGNVESYPGGNGDTCTQVSSIGAQFSAQPSSGTAPLSVVFTDLSQGTGITSWTWDFGDGTPSAHGVGPHTHVYQRGTWVATLTISNGAESSTAQQTINVYERVVADFTATPTRGIVPLNVTFANRSTGDYSSLTWDFGDGSPVEHGTSATHAYPRIGTYTATLTASGNGGVDSKSTLITVTPPLGDAVGHVNLQGRPAPPNARWSMPLTVTTIRDHTETNTRTLQADAAGYFTMTLSPGTYDILVKHSHTLARKATLSILGGDVVPVEIPTLWEGDASNSNAVEQEDVGILSASYNRGKGGAGYDDRADFNVDEWVGIADLSLLSSNFGKSGDIVAQGASGTGDARHFYMPMIGSAGNSSSSAAQAAGVSSLSPDRGSQVPANISLESVSRVAPRAIFAMDIRADGGNQAVDAAEAHLSFDPALVEVVSITSDVSSMTPVFTAFDNVRGELAIASGNFSGKAVDGEFTLATVHFRAKAEGHVALTVQRTPAMGQTAIYSRGASLPLSPVSEDRMLSIEPATTSRGSSRVPGLARMLPASLQLAAASATTVTLEFVSEPSMIPVGGLALVSLYVNAGTQPVDAVDIYINFDPSKIRITNASGAPATEIYRDTGTMPLSPLLDQVNNDTGRIDFAAGVAGGQASGRFRVGYMYVYALSPGGITVMSLNYGTSRNSSAYLLGFPVPVALNDIAIPVEVPEPMTVVLLGSGLASLATYMRIRRRRA
ncbi:MAG: S8 family serine peptidase [Chloroflexi bacterium]|nr:S8 family serine peptidase [Chloroflexota bacterium]